jgi:hypothetical protein
METVEAATKVVEETKGFYWILVLCLNHLFG